LVVTGVTIPKPTQAKLVSALVKFMGKAKVKSSKIEYKYTSMAWCKQLSLIDFKCACSHSAWMTFILAMPLDCYATRMNACAKMTQAVGSPFVS